MDSMETDTSSSSYSSRYAYVVAGSLFDDVTVGDGGELLPSLSRPPTPERSFCGYLTHDESGAGIGTLSFTVG